jgi:hypothetical protein
MNDHQERTVTPADEVVLQDTKANHPEANLPTEETAHNGQTVPVASDESPSTAEVDGASANGVNAEAAQDTGGGERRWHAEAGRKGARRVHQLLQEGKLYEQEHGLKSGRQRLRQLIELGKLYEQEHGLKPDRPKRRGKRLSRLERDEVLATFLQCLLRIAKPSFRADLVRLVEALTDEETSHAA